MDSPAVITDTKSNDNTPAQPVPKRRPSLLIGNQNSPSLAFLHKPARNLSDDSKEHQRLMEENTRKNKMQHSNREEVISPSIASSVDDMDGSKSPSSLHFPLVRKKSGEFVRSSLKSHSRSLSLPSTPTYKSVHFGGDDREAEVKYFDERDTPQAISGNNSPTGWGARPRDYFNLNGDIDDLYSDYDENALEEDDDDSKGSTRSDESYNTRLLLRGEWKLTLSNFPDLSYPLKFRNDSKVFLERIFISDDKQNLCGQIAVKNVSFMKKVVVRYSVDSWRSVTEIDCHYVTNATAKLRRNKYDRFEFEIPVVTLFHNTVETFHPAFTDVSSKFALCIKYSVSGEDFWDNNNFENFNVILHKITPKTADTHRVDTHYPKSAKHSSKYLAKRKEEGKPLSPDNVAVVDDDDPSKAYTPSQAIFNHFINLANQDSYSPNSPDTPRMTNSPYSPIELNPKNKEDYSIDKLDINFPPPKSPLSPTSSPMEPELSPLSESPDPNSSLEHQSPPKFHPSDRPPISSAKYQELLDKFCFFGGDSSSSTATVSSVLGDNKKKLKPTQEAIDRPTYFLGNNGSLNNNNNFNSSYMATFDGSHGVPPYTDTSYALQVSNDIASDLIVESGVSSNHNKEPQEKQNSPK